MRDKNGRFIKGFATRTGIKHTEETKMKISLKKKLNGDTPPKEFMTGKHIHGNKHWNWKGGISSFDYLERRRFQKQIQKLVFERDNFQCVIGGKEHGTNLQVDHIQSWKDYVELRFSIDNCRTLCMDCHYQITFGKPMPLGVKAWGHNLGKKGGWLS